MSAVNSLEEFFDSPVLNENPKEFLQNVIAYMINGPDELNFWGYMTSFIPLILVKEKITARLVYSTQFSMPIVEIGDEFLKRLNLQETIFLIYHEYKHYLDMHPFRVQNRNPRIANYAQDREINSSALETFDKRNAYPIKKLNLFYRYPGWGPTTYEKIYEVEKELHENGSASTDKGFIKAIDVEGELLDEHDWESFESTDIESEANKIRRIIDSCSDQAGNKPYGVDRYLKELIKPKINPLALISNWASSLIKEDYNESYANINHACIDLPGCVYKTTPSIFIVQDTSGSMSDEDLQKSLGVIEYLLRENTLNYLPVDAYEPSRSDVKEVNLNEIKSKGLSVIGGGGTVLGPAINLADSLPEVDGVICLTDGALYEDLDKINIGKPLLWMTTSHSKLLSNSKWPVVEI